jgi:ribosomal protein S18 acetylase RimI-like enzyme
MRGALANLDAELDARGWTVHDITLVMTAALDDVLQACPDRQDLPRAELAARPSPEWLEGYVYRGRTLPPSAVAVLVNASDPVFALVRRGDARLGVARGAIADGWLGVTAVTVDLAHRRQGVATHLLAELARWGRRRGAAHVYLQVGVENTAAVLMYRRLGFDVHHRYHYRRAPS